MNGFTTEDDSRGDEPMDVNQRLIGGGATAGAGGTAGPSGAAAIAHGHSQTCCLLDRGDRCSRPAGNASYNKRIGKTGERAVFAVVIFREDHAQLTVACACGGRG